MPTRKRIRLSPIFDKCVPTVRHLPIGYIYNFILNFIILLRKLKILIQFLNLMDGFHPVGVKRFSLLQDYRRLLRDSHGPILGFGRSFEQRTEKASFFGRRGRETPRRGVCDRPEGWRLVIRMRRRDFRMLLRRLQGLQIFGSDVPEQIGLQI